MKKKIAIVVVLVLIASLFGGCIILAYGAAGIVQGALQEAGEAIFDAIGDAIWEGAVAGPKRKRALQGKDSPFDNELERRLLRRNSTMLDGTLVDITPYLLHDDSFQSIEGVVTRSENLIDIRSVKDPNQLFEFVASISFEAKKQPYQLELNVATVEADEKTAKRFVEKNLWPVIAKRYELELKDIKKRKVKYDKPLTRLSRLPFSYKSLLISEVEPCYYQFDVEVEYQKTNNVLRKLKPEDFATFSKVYRSNYKIMAAAAIDVQASIWTDAIKVGFSDYNIITQSRTSTPMPRVNFVKVERYEKN